MTLFKQEMKRNRKTLLLWSSCVGFCCLGCIWLFGGLQDSMEQMAQAYGQMGAFSAALGLDRISVSTLEGFFATEVALLFAIGGAMFGAMTGVCMLAGEEEGHTSEFLNTLPLGRRRIVLEKYLSMAALILLFHLLCILWELAGFGLAGAVTQGTELKGKEPAFWEALGEIFTRAFLEKLALFHGAQLLAHLEIGSVCFLLSAFCRKRQVGSALGFAVLLYVMDLMCRIMPDLEKLKYVTPYYFSNATDIFTGSRIEAVPLVVGLAVTAAAVFGAFVIYERKDLAA